MYFGIGFLVATLLGLLFIPAIHNRAVRLTAQRLQTMIPQSVAEIHAEKDLLRAEFAQSTRRLEIAMEEMQNRLATQLGELSRKTNTINQLKTNLSEKAVVITALELRCQTLRDQLSAGESLRHLAGEGARPRR